MSDTALKLKSPPIIEAILDIECDFAPGQSIVGLEEAAAEKFRDCYPKLRKQFALLMTAFGSESPVGDNMPAPSIIAFQFLQEDERQLVQLRENGYSFNRLAPYHSLDEYLPEIKRAWDIYRDLAKPTLVRVVRLRYVNRLNIPLVDQKVDLDSYFKTGPRIPGEDRLVCVGFLNQYQLLEVATGYHVAIILTPEKVKNDKLPVIFDSIVAADMDADPSDWQSLEETILSLRRLKNRVFSDTLTEQCLSLFQ